MVTALVVLGAALWLLGWGSIAVEKFRSGEVRHGVYGKSQKKTSKFVAHDENGEAKEGDVVAIAESRPLSARKRWVVTRVVEKAQKI